MNSQWQFLPAKLGSIRTPLGRNGLRAFGRFRTVRRAYSRIQRLKPSGGMRFHPINVEAKDLVMSASAETYFDHLFIDDCLCDLRLNGISQAFHLPESVVDNIVSYAQEARFQVNGSGEKGLVAEFQARRDAGLHTPARVICTDIAKSKEIVSILSDRSLHQVAGRYLGYAPRICEVYLEALLWTASASGESGYQPYNYHYDIPGFGFIAFFFYLSAVDEHNGPHVIIRKSHNRKPMNLLLRSGQSAGKLAPIYYDRDLELTVKGPKGHGFAEDLYAFHKVLRPICRDRMSLQIRFY